MAGFPVVLSDRGAPFVAVEKGAPLATVAENGRGLPIRVVEKGAPPLIIQGYNVWSPADLFENGEFGTWYDPSFLDTLFQDENGTTPAVPGSPVGSVLDARQELGPELWDWNYDPIITNDGTAGAYDKTTRTFSNSQAGSSPSRPYFRFITVEIGKRYRFKAKFSGQLNAIFSLTLNSGSTSSSPSFGGISGDDIRANGGVIDAIVSTVGNGIFTLWTDGRTTWDGLILEECSIREVLNPPLSQPTTAARPILARMPLTGRRNMLTWTEDFSNEAWNKTDAVTQLLGNGEQRVAFSSGSASVRRTTTSYINFKPTDIGRTAVLSCKVKAFNESSVGKRVILRNQTPGFLFSKTITLTADYQDVVLEGTIPSGATQGEFRLLNFALENTDQDFVVKDCQYEIRDTPTKTPYQRVTNAYDVTEAGVPDTYSLVYDLADDNLTTTLPQAINGDILIAGTKGSIIEPVNYAAESTFTIGPDTYTGGTPGILRAVGDVVGVVLIDRELTQNERENLLRHYKGKGAKGLLVPGPELVVNGTFDTDLTGWAASGGAEVSWDNGEMIVNVTGASGGFTTSPGVPVDTSKVYETSIVVRNIDYTGAFSFTFSATVTSITPTVDKNTFKLVGMPASANANVRTARLGSPTGRYAVDAVSVRELRPQEDWT